jgi:bifunctional oligoribonuclease and PAP phosphatase NrnA
MYPETEKIDSIVSDARKILIVQADNPDADSLGSALALELILGDMGKEPTMYCGADIPVYLRYLSGWDRVAKELPDKFDASIIVDASTMTLLEKPVEAGHQKKLAAKPCVVLDHHQTVENPIPFATAVINDHGRASAGELIYNSQAAGVAAIKRDPKLYC